MEHSNCSGMKRTEICVPSSSAVGSRSGDSESNVVPIAPLFCSLGCDRI